jgi:hypothetical protein
MKGEFRDKGPPAPGSMLPFVPGPGAPRLLETFEELEVEIRARRVIVDAVVAHAVLLVLAEWLAMMSDKAPAMADKERNAQKTKAREHHREWARSAAYRGDLGGQGCTQDGGITAVGHAWNPNAADAHFVPFADAEWTAVQRTRLDKRHQERVAAAVAAFLKYQGYGGLAQCAADRVRMWNNRESERGNMPDSRRCPRCYALGHFASHACRLIQTPATPLMIPTLANNAYMATDGTALTTMQFTWCSRCGLWGHRRELCVRCGLCNRWGHAQVDCQSQLAPGRYVPPRPQGDRR